VYFLAAERTGGISLQTGARCKYAFTLMLWRVGSAAVLYENTAPNGRDPVARNDSMQFRLKRGLDVPIAGQAAQRLHPGPAVARVGLLGAEYRGMKPSLLTEPGTEVRCGQAILRDRHEPRIQVTAPAGGVIEAVHRGTRRELHSVVIKVSGDEAVDFAELADRAQSSSEAAALEELLLASGLWVAFRTRPFGHVPRPGRPPAAIFITAIDTQPLAADPAVVLAGHHDEFLAGQRALTRLTTGPVYVCTATGAGVPVVEDARVAHAEFSGPHPAGLPGTHIHFLAPASAKRTVWHVGYQDVVALGRLLVTGRLDRGRVIALGGPAVRQPRLIATVAGASTDDLVRGELERGECRVISGSVLSGYRAADWAAFLGRHHTQVTVLFEGHQREFLGWLLPGRRKFSATNAFASSLAGPERYALTTSYNGSPRAMVPIGSYERVMPLDILPTQLLRALLVGDTDTAQALGCLELDEEDLALCSFVCPGKYDYGPVLRRALERIEKEG
jgi:Na+-transporting NADH:ubiquinone oxidoreductase subunit A